VPPRTSPKGSARSGSSAPAGSPNREEIVELVTNRRFSYAQLSGLAIRGYRADVDLEPTDGGTLIRWHSSFDPKVPGTGRLYRRQLSRFIEQTVKGLAARADEIDREQRRG
jgi:Polyketide cyclase / dehydrase and lipid transport